MSTTVLLINMPAFIYKIENAINNKIYIGFSINIKQRLADHKNKYKKLDSKLYRAIRKYGIDNFSFEIIYCSNDIEYTLNTMEPYFIGIYNAFSNGYNATIGGDKWNKGAIRSTELRKRISNKLKGISHSPERRINIGEGQSRFWLIVFPDGKEVTIKNLRKFCDDHSLHNANMYKVAKGQRKQHHGFKCKELI